MFKIEIEIQLNFVGLWDLGKMKFTIFFLGFFISKNRKLFALNHFIHLGFVLNAQRTHLFLMVLY